MFQMYFRLLKMGAVKSVAASKKKLSWWLGLSWQLLE